MNAETLNDQAWIRRCFALATRGIGHVSPNPPVGAVLVYDGKIIGEGYHTGYGNAHAEVEALRSVEAADQPLIPSAVLYVSLEPCCITSKTPPCTDLIISAGIRDVRVSTLDPNPAVAGKGIAMLKLHGIKTAVGILEKEGQRLIRSFTTNILHMRPHIVLKWAQSKFNYVGMADQRIYLSQPASQYFTHRLRHVADAILIGARTVEIDDPALTVREYPGRSPQRVIYDPQGKLNHTHRVFADDGCKVFYFSTEWNPLLTASHITQMLLHGSDHHASQMVTQLFERKIGHLLVEGGAHTHQLFINDSLWDEAWVIQTEHPLSEGIKAPNVRGRLIEKMKVATDRIIGIAPDVIGD